MNGVEATAADEDDVDDAPLLKGDESFPTLKKAFDVDDARAPRARRGGAASIFTADDASSRTSSILRRPRRLLTKAAKEQWFLGRGQT